MSKWTRRKRSDGASFCLELGAGLLENGAETSRVEETIRMAGEALGMAVEAMVHPTGITVGFGNGETVTQVARIKNRTLDLSKVAELNRLSRDLHLGHLALNDCRRRVAEIRQAPSIYNDAQHMLATAVACACLTVVVGGGFGEAMVGLLAGCASTWMLGRFGGGFPSFLSLFAVAFVCSVFGIAAGAFQLKTEPIVVGALLHQMPGLALVSATRDLMAGELVAGNARMAEAVLVTLGMASGVLACFGLALRIGIQAG